MLQGLPRELVDKILLFTDIRTCIKHNNLYCVSKIYNTNSWVELARSDDLDSMKYLYNNKIGEIPVDILSMFCIGKNKLEVVKWLIEKDKLHTMALLDAIENDNLEMVKVISNHERYTDEIEENIEDAVSFGNSEIFIYLCDTFSCEYALNFERLTEVSCIAGSSCSLAYLVNLGHLPNENNVLDAIYNGNLEIVKYIGEELNYVFDKRAVYDAIFSDSAEMLMYIIGKVPQVNDALSISILEGLFSQACILVNSGYFINTGSLYLAIDSGSEELIGEFLKHHVEINSACITLAISLDNKKLARELLRRQKN